MTEARYEQENIKPYSSKGSKGTQVKKMFNNIAGTYDRLNHIMSVGTDRLWRRSAVSALQSMLPSCKEIIDIGTGTGDLAILLGKRYPEARITGIDISDGMLDIARQKTEKEEMSDRITLVNADCSNLPFPDKHFDALTSSFVLRNFESLDASLSEMHRVLKDDGAVSIIDLCRPVSFPMKQLFGIYERTVMPSIGKMISDDKTAYTYLPATINAISQGDEMRDIFIKAGFRDVKYKRLIFGMCMLYTARR